jgi:EAL domain-containing protein (putative c-di-GMP-specific phosphodiesterase class I)
VTVAIDDFGTGYSSLAYLARLPVDKLKIDRSFVSSVDSSGESTTLVTTMIALAHGLKMAVVAEGVETEDQARLLRLLRCDEAQGYHFSKPVPAAEFARFLGR